MAIRTIQDRDVLFANEAFLVSMLQAVSGGTIVASFSQSDHLVKWAGAPSFLLLITGASLALVLAVIAAYWKHQYKMWDIKAQASMLSGNIEESNNREKLASFYLRGMRVVLMASMLFILAALVQMVVSLWLFREIPIGSHIA